MSKDSTTRNVHVELSQVTVASGSFDVAVPRNMTDADAESILHTLYLDVSHAIEFDGHDTEVDYLGIEPSDLTDDTAAEYRLVQDDGGEWRLE
jgi:hypothetical protein